MRFLALLSNPIAPCASVQKCPALPRVTASRDAHDAPGCCRCASLLIKVLHVLLIFVPSAAPAAVLSKVQTDDHGDVELVDHQSLAAKHAVEYGPDVPSTRRCDWRAESHQLPELAQPSADSQAEEALHAIAEGRLTREDIEVVVAVHGESTAWTEPVRPSYIASRGRAVG